MSSMHGLYLQGKLVFVFPCMCVCVCALISPYSPQLHVPREEEKRS